MTLCKGHDSQHLLAFLTVRIQDSMLMKKKLEVKKVVLNTKILE